MIQIDVVQSKVRRRFLRQAPFSIGCDAPHAIGAHFDAFGQGALHRLNVRGQLLAPLATRRFVGEAIFSDDDR